MSRRDVAHGAVAEAPIQLEGVDTEGVPATAHGIPLATPLREDEPDEVLAPNLAMANAPAARGTAFTVPRVLDDEAEG